MVRTPADTTTVVSAVRAIVREQDPQLPVGEARAMSDVLAGSAAQPRFRAVILVLFAGLALLLAAVGVYGVVSQAVAQCVPEIGIRVALGASQGQMLMLILRHGLTLAVAGLAVGLAVALAMTRLIASLLFDVETTDPATFTLVSVLLLAVAVVASYVPARRAMNVDPVVALRAE
jgi:ABC-type antimicrobial peptide transport system permease subunit